MKAIPRKTERIHSLDSLRAIMMLLGLVIHSALTYAVFDFGEGWPLKDPFNTNLSNDFIVYFIHSFRMPIFFVVAGFFGSLLFYERNVLKMFNNRVSRIVFPFIVFLLLLWPFLIFAGNYTELIFDGSNTAFNTVGSYFSNPIIFIPQGTFHLWFLYYLSLITFSSLILGLIFKKLPRLSKQISKSFSWIITKPIIRILLFSSFMSVICLWLETYVMSPPFSLIPDIGIFIFYFFFYIIGWILFKSKHLLDHLMRFDWGCFLLGLLLVCIHFVFMSSLTLEINILLNSIIVWLLIFGITGLFIRYGSKHSQLMRYVSDASYWVYLIHLFFTLLIPSLIVDWPLPATLKFLFVLISTGVICFVSYHYLVRGTFIGNILNGRTYSKKLSDIKLAGSLSHLKPTLDE
jgi:glucan biosynthesis protein C